MAYTKAPFRVFVHFILVVVLLVAFSSTIKSQTPSDFIKAGQEISQEIKSLDTHSYKITLKTGQYLKLFLEAEKLALEVNLLAPSGENVLRVETDNKEINREELEIVAKSTGTYLLEVISLDNMVAPSPYRVEVKDIRKALLKDKNRCIAKDLTGQANVLQKVGTPIGFEKSVERYLSALPFWRKAGEQAAIADIHRKIAESYYLISKYSESIDYFTKELEFRRSNKERSREARAIKNLGLVYYAMGDDEQALKHYNEALALGKELNNRELIAQTLNLLGTLYRSNGEGRKSIEYNRESLNLWEELNEIEETVKITQDVAASYYSLAEIKDALAFYEKALVAAEKENNKISQAKLLSSMAIIYDEIGDISHALNYYNQALNKWRSLKSPNKESIASELEILENIGKIYYKQKDTRQALNFLEEASELAKESKDNFSQAQILNSIGNVYRASGESRKAIEFYSDALMLHKQNNDLVSTSITATEVAKTHLELGDGDKAVGFFTEAYKLNQRQGNRAIEAGIFYHLGLALEFNYEEEKAIASYKQGIIVAKELQDKIQEAQFNYRLSLLEKRRGHLKESQLSIEKAIELIENLPSKLVKRQLANNYLSKATDYFELYIDLLMQQHKLNPSNANDLAALRVSERERTYILLDLMTTSEINLSANSNKDLVLQENNLKQLISDKTSKLVRFNIAEAPVHEIGEIERELKALSNQLKDLQTEIKQKNPHYANFSQPTPLNLKEIQENILDPETVFLEYSLGNEQSYLWVVSQTEIKSFYLPKRSEIESLAKYLRELVTARNLLAKGEKNIGGRPITLELAENEYPKVALDLSKMLLSPIAEKLGKKRLVIIADGALQYIPFNALPDPSKTDSYQALLVDHEIVSLPSITTINTIREETKDSKLQAKTVMFVADPIVSLVDNRVRVKPISKDSALLNTSTDLKEANLLIEKSAKEVGLPLTTQGLPRLSVVEDEVKEISQILSKEENKQLFSFNASLSSLSKESSPYKAIHFATYGLVNSLHPELSGVVLSIADEQGNLQDGFLQTHKIFKLNLPTELVTLSNCDTTLSKNAQEEGLTGLTRSFIYAGAKRVMANLWNTNDPASIELMKKFYQKTLKENQAPAFALRAAQLEMLQDEKYKNPFYWAGFQLQGEWK
ncbi:MAG: CHAT domain-containing protein [Acidobacteria bacterium]|nr:CHAT domain-containing protein [Acidobacteriota bacterium]